MARFICAGVTMARPGLDKNVKFKLLVRALNLPKPYVRGLLETMWDVAHESGNPILGSPAAVEAAAEWPGESGQFFAAASRRDCAFVDEVVLGVWAIHDYWHHAPEYVKGRQRKEEQRKKSGQSRDTNGTVTGQSRDNDATVPKKSDTPNTLTQHPTPNPLPLTPAPDDGRTLGIAEFDEFWKEYPAQINPLGSRRAWLGMMMPISEFPKIMAGLAAWKISDRWTKEGGKYIKEPQNFLRDRLWESPPKNDDVVKPLTQEDIKNRVIEQRKRASS